MSEQRPPVLALRALGLGDALTGVAPLRGLRRAFPDRRLVLAAPAAVGGWLCDLGVVDDVLPSSGLAPLRWPADGVGPADDGGPADGRSSTGHLAVNLHGRGPESHQVLQATRPERLIAFASPQAGHADGPDWCLDEHEVERWCRLVSAAGGPCGPEDLRLPRPAHVERRADVVLHPGAASASRRWPVERWTEVAAALVLAGCDVVLTGGETERDLCDAVVRGVRYAVDGLPPAGDTRVRSVAGRLDLPGLADVVAGARLVLCGDTGVAHLATAFATPSVLLFGPMPPHWWGPAIDQERHTVLWHGDPDRPGDPHGEELDPALAVITVDEVLDAARHRLAAG